MPVQLTANFNALFHVCDKISLEIHSTRDMLLLLNLNCNKIEIDAITSMI